MVSNFAAFTNDLITFIFGFSQFGAAVCCSGLSGSRLHAHARFHRLTHVRVLVKSVSWQIHDAFAIHWKGLVIFQYVKLRIQPVKRISFVNNVLMKPEVDLW